MKKLPLKPSTKQITKRCHWVPQVYLKAFAADESGQKIWRFSKVSGEPELKPIDKVAVSFYLYVPRDAESGQRDDSFEHKLSKLERWFHSDEWKIFQTDTLDLSEESLRMLIGLLVATMMLRNPNYFEFYKSSHKILRKFMDAASHDPKIFEYKEKVLDTNSWPAFRDATEDDLKRNWIKDMNDATHYAVMLMKMRWSVLCSDKPVFITTDAPVTFIHPSLEFRGINDPETVIIFPISPTRLLCMDHRLQEPSNQYYQLDGDGSIQNLLLWRNSLEYMFSHRHTDLVCASLNAEAERRKTT